MTALSNAMAASMDRRRFLGLAAASAAGTALSGCGSLERIFGVGAAALPTVDAPPIVHLLNRVTFGPVGAEIDLARRIGAAEYINRQLAPEKIDEPFLLTWRLRQLGDILTPDTALLFDEDDRRLVLALRQATTLRAVYSRRQLYERMVEFWSDHFNIYAFKNEGPQLKVVDDRETVRAHALGSFHDLLMASARSAAMLGYLDNAVNRKGRPNENYAREVMELHTLGVDGGYTQQDVHELARCLTGWTSQKHWWRGRFEFDADVHDDGAKQVLGLHIAPGGGVTDAERVLAVLAGHPSTARHIARKLCTYFVGNAPDGLVDSVGAVFLHTHGDIKSVVRAVLMSAEFKAGTAILKRPFDYLVSALRALNADTDAGAGIQDHLEGMGQSLFGWPMPNGYPVDARSWSGGLIPRWNFALELLSGRINGTHVNIPSLIAAGRQAGVSAPDALAEFAFARPATDAVVRGVQSRIDPSLDPRQYAAMLLMSPEFQWR